MDEQKTTKKESLTDAKREKVRVIPIQFFDDFPSHPLKVKMDEDMEALIESVKEFVFLLRFLPARRSRNGMRSSQGTDESLQRKNQVFVNCPLFSEI